MNMSIHYLNKITVQFKILSNIFYSEDFVKKVFFYVKIFDEMK